MGGSDESGTEVILQFGFWGILNLSSTTTITIKL